MTAASAQELPQPEDRRRLTHFGLFRNNVSGNVGALFSLTPLTRSDQFGITVLGDVRALSRMTSLTHLGLLRTDVSGDGRALSPLASLTHFDLTYITVSGDVRTLFSLTSLTHLDPLRTKVSAK